MHPCTHAPNNQKVYKLLLILTLISCAILHTDYTFSQGQGQGLWNAIGQDGVTTNRKVSIYNDLSVAGNAIFDSSLTARSLYSYYLSVSDNTTINRLSVGGDARFYRPTYFDSLMTANAIRAQLLGSGVIISDSAQLESVVSTFINAAQINGIDISSTKITAERINTDTVVTVVLSCGNAKFTGTVLASDISTGALTVTGTSTLHKIIVSDGVTVTSLAGNGQGLIQYDTTGKLTQLDFTNDSNAVLTGSGTFRSINTLVPPDTGWQWVGSDLITTANDVYIPNSLNVGKTISIGPFKIKNGGTRDTIRTAAALAIISDAQNINLEADTVRMPNYVEAPNIRSSQLQVSGDAIISNNLSVGGYMSIGTGTKMISNGSYRDTLRTAKELSVISDGNLIKLEADTVRMAQLVEAGKVNTPIGNIDSLTSDKIRTARLSVSGDIEAMNGTVRSNEVSTSTITTNDLTINTRLTSPMVVTSKITSPDSILSLGDSTIKFNDTYNYMYTENEALRIFAIGTTGNPPQNLMLQTAVGSGNTIIGSTVGIASFTPAQDALLDIRNNQFQVNIYGNLVRINGVSYSWPSMNVGTGSILTNDGTGTLSWSTPGSLSSALSSDLWSLTGNSGTTAGTNFLGTTDAADLVFKTNNFERMIIEKVNGNVGIGTSQPEDKFQVGSGENRLVTGSAGYTTLGYGTSYLGFNASRYNNEWHINTDYVHNGGGVIFGNIFGDIKFAIAPTTDPGTANQNLTDADILNNTIMTISNNGKVGIGTSNPEKELHVKTTHGLDLATGTFNDERSHNGIRLEDELISYLSGNPQNYLTTKWDIVPANGNLLFGTPVYPGNPDYDPATGTKPLVVIQPDGNVGIGTNTPSEKLDVNGNIRLNENDLFFRSDVPDGNHGIGWYGVNNDFNRPFAGESVDGPVVYGFSGGALGINQWGTTQSIVLKWTSDGNVGIGTSTPSEKLEVNGNIRINENDIFFRSDVPDGNHGIGWYGVNNDFNRPFAGESVDGPVLYGFSGGALGANQWGPQNIALRWTGDGNVGIGTFDIPSGYKLAVNGNIIAVDVMIKEYSQWWPDYVLKPGYKRMTFEEQTKYYWENNHLDGLPSAEEIAKGNTGVSTLLRGITKNLEETRLDAIDLNKEVIDLRSELKKKDKMIDDLLKRVEKLEKRK